MTELTWREKKKIRHPDYVAKEKEWNRKKYLKNRKAIIAKTKLYRASPDGKARRNASDRAAWAAKSPEQKAKHQSISERALKKRMIADKLFADRVLERCRLNMRRLRKEDEDYKAKNKAYQREWRKAKRQRAKLDDEFDAFMRRLNKEMLLEPVNQILKRRAGAKSRSKGVTA